MSSPRSMTIQSTAPKIAIVGGGPGGLTLARLLEVQGIEYVVYERDAKDSPHRTGGSLDIHPRTGQEALRQAGLLQQFLKHARYEDTTVTLADKTGKRLARVGSEDTSPEIDRASLRQLLLDAIPGHKIRWGHALRETVLDGNGRPLLQFADGSTASGFDLIVGADGAWSKVRSLLTDSKPKYTGKTYLESKTAHDNNYHAELDKNVGAGLFMAIGDNTPIVIQRQGDRSYRTYFGLQVPEGYFHHGDGDLSDISGTRNMLLTQSYAGWAQEYVNLVRHVDGFRAWTLYTLSIEDIRWKPLSCATLIGDAAHLSYPGSSGVNLAMLDAMTLVSKIVEHGKGGLAQAVHEYEEAMFPRGVKAIGEGTGMAHLMFDQSPNEFLKLLSGGHES